MLGDWPLSVAQLPLGQWVGDWHGITQTGQSWKAESRFQET